MEKYLLRCKISCLHYKSLSQVLDNHIQRILCMCNICRYMSDIGIVWLPSIGIGIGPKSPISVGPYQELMLFLCHANKDKFAFLSEHNESQHDDTDIRFRGTNGAFSLNSTNFSFHCLCFNCLHSVCNAAHEVGRTPEQPASQHVWWCYTESNVIAHGAGHLQQAHQKLQLWSSLLLYQKTGAVGAGQPFPGMQGLFCFVWFCFNVGQIQHSCLFFP